MVGAATDGVPMAGMSELQLEIEPVSALLSKRCFAAAQQASQCAVHCLSVPHTMADRTAEIEACAEWCMVASRVLATCSDVIGGWSDDARMHLVEPLAQAGLIAAEECTAAAEPLANDIASCADAADGCRKAADELRRLLDECARPPYQAPLPAAGT
jgi:hypothetical protein